MRSNQELYSRAMIQWGERRQILAFIEEMAELTVELSKCLNAKNSKGNVFEELADVEIMLEQMRLCFDWTKVAGFKAEKLDRLERHLFPAPSVGEEQ